MTRKSSPSGVVVDVVSCGTNSLCTRRAASASRRRRSMSIVSTKARLTTLRATRCPELRVVASNTSPIPPRPMESSRRYFPPRIAPGPMLTAGHER